MGIIIVDNINVPRKNNGKLTITNTCHCRGAEHLSFWHAGESAVRADLAPKGVAVALPVLQR